MMIALSGNLKAQERKKGEVFLGGSLLLNAGIPAGSVSLGGYSKFIGAELNEALLSNIVIIGGNVVIGPFELKGIPYATAGIWTTGYGRLRFNAGGGVKFKVSDDVALRAEYRRYFFGDGWGVDTISAGISFLF